MKINWDDNEYTIGIDFGSLSARAVLMRVSDGKVVYSTVFDYPHGVLSDVLLNGKALPSEYALQIPSDYREGLYFLIRKVVEESGISPEQIIGVGLDATSTTLLPTTADGIPMCELEEYKDNPHAYIKMWKHHAAQKQAESILRLAAEEKETWLCQFGDFISGEHFLPKAAQIADEDPEFFDKCDKILEVGDWLVWLLTGKESRNYCAAAFKTYCNQNGEDVSPDFLAKINPGLRTLSEKLPGNIVHPGDRAGEISDECAKITGLKPGTPVSAAGVDAHVSSIGCKTANPKDVLLIIGTSTCIIMVGNEYREIKGINGVVPDGIIKGKNAYEGGQSAVGDMFAFFCDNYVSADYFNEANEKNISIQELLSEKADKLKPGENGLVALDWINGVRSTLMDFDLSGLICGITPKTKSEDIYRALVESTAYGAKKIVSQLSDSGVEISRIFAGGGIPLKNPMLVQIYADVFDKDIYVVDEPYSTAVGSAMLGLAASEKMNGYASLMDIMDMYKTDLGAVYHPIKENVEIYQELYSIYSDLYEQFGKKNEVMKKLKRIRSFCKI